MPPIATVPNPDPPNNAPIPVSVPPEVRPAPTPAITDPDVPDLAETGSITLAGLGVGPMIGSGNASGSGVGGQTPMMDETDLKRRLKAEYSEIAQLAGGLAHEIRNPLSTIRLNLDLLAEDFQNAESPQEQRARRKIERIQKESHRLQQLLEDFLRLARVQDLKREATDLNAVVADMVDFCMPQADAQGVLLRVFTSEDVLMVPLDVNLFKQALFNLILNALNAMPDGGELILQTRREHGFGVVEVIDTGNGITADLQARVFEPFYSTRPGGNGLGLPTVRRIVQAHDGAIQLHSEPGKGTRFTIRLPRPETDPAIHLP